MKKERAAIDGGGLDETQKFGTAGWAVGWSRKAPELVGRFLWDRDLNTLSSTAPSPLASCFSL